MGRRKKQQGFDYIDDVIVGTDRSPGTDFFVDFDVSAINRLLVSGVSVFVLLSGDARNKRVSITSVALLWAPTGARVQIFRRV